MKFYLNSLSKEFLKSHVSEFIAMAERTIEDENWKETNFLADLNRKWELSFYASDHQSTIVGFLVASDKGTSIHIHKFVVDTQSQGKGLGTLMFNYLLKKADRPVTLKVQKKNTNAIDFYLKKGFVMNGQQNDLYTMIYTLDYGKTERKHSPA